MWLLLSPYHTIPYPFRTCITNSWPLFLFYSERSLRQRLLFRILRFMAKVCHAWVFREHSYTMYCVCTCPPSMWSCVCQSWRSRYRTWWTRRWSFWAWSWWERACPCLPSLCQTSKSQLNIFCTWSTNLRREGKNGLRGCFALHPCC